MNNTIILMHGSATLTINELIRQHQYDSLNGCDSNPIEEMRWSIDQEDLAKAELAKHACTYSLITNDTQLVDIDEWQLEYCECDEDGEFVSGSDLDYADGEWPYEVGRRTVSDRRVAYLDDGCYYTMDELANYMDDEIREDLHSKMAPCAAQEFVDAYVKRHFDKFGEEFTI